MGLYVAPVLGLGLMNEARSGGRPTDRDSGGLCCLGMDLCQRKLVTGLYFAPVLGLRLVNEARSAKRSMDRDSVGLCCLRMDICQR